MVQPVSSSNTVVAVSPTAAHPVFDNPFVKALRVLARHILQHLSQHDKAILRAVNRDTRSNVEPRPAVPKEITLSSRALQDVDRLNEIAQHVARSPAKWPIHVQLQLDLLKQPLDLPANLIVKGVQKVTLNVRSVEHLQDNINNLLRAMPNLEEIVVEDVGAGDARAVGEAANRLVVRAFCPDPGLLGKLQRLDLGMAELNRPGETLKHLAKHAPQMTQLSLRTRGVPAGARTTYKPLTASDAAQFAADAAENGRLKKFKVTFGGCDDTSQALVDALGPVLDGLEGLWLQSQLSAAPDANGLATQPADLHSQTLKLLGAYAPNLRHLELSLVRRNGLEPSRLPPDVIKAFLRSHPNLETLRFNRASPNALMLDEAEKNLICERMGHGSPMQIKVTDDIEGLAFKVRPNASRV